MSDAAFDEEVEIPELVALFGELHIQEIYNTYLVESFSRLKKLKLLFSKYRIEKETRRIQLDFVHKVQLLAKDTPLINRAYLILGALQFVQGRWSSFPNSGALYELTLKADDLEQMISENAKTINLEKLFSNPNLIKEMADESLRRIIAKNPELLV